MPHAKKRLETASYVTVAITLVLFVVALFVKGFTHDLLLEAGVFLVSAKLVIMGRKNSLLIGDVQEELREIRALLEGRSPTPRPPAT